jgi:hypothetical protein
LIIFNCKKRFDEFQSVFYNLRSTIFWQPNVVGDENGKASLSFFTADISSIYSVIVEGVNEEGKLIYQRADAVIEIR